MDQQELTERLEANLERLLGWIAAADAKTSTVFAFSTAMLGVFAGLLPRADSWTRLSAFCSLIAAVLLALSLLFSTFAAFPRTSGPRGSLLFFGGIADRTAESYLQDLKAASHDTYLEDLARQCHRNAQIAQSKYAWVRRAMAALYLSVLPWIAGIFLLYWEK